MLRTIIKPWWAIILMGVLFIITAIIIFKNPATTLVAVAFWIGWLVLFAGFAAVVSYFAAEKEERQTSTILVGIGTVFAAFLMISKFVITIKAITILFGIILLAIGIWLISFAWRLRAQLSMWWLTGLIGLAAVIIGLKSIWDIQAGAEAISNMMGIGFLFAGIGLLVLGYFKKQLVHSAKEKWQTMKDRNAA